MNNNHKDAIDFLRINDPVISTIIEKVGICWLTPSDTYFKNLMKSVVSQQLSLTVARTIWERFEKLNYHKFTPQNILEIDHQSLRNIGFSNSKAKYIKEIAFFFQNNPEFSTNVRKMTDEEVIKELTKIKGVGIWTAKMFLIFSLCRNNILPLDDIGFKRSVKLHYKFKQEVSEKDLLKISKKWGNYKSIAVWYLWKALEIK